MSQQSWVEDLKSIRCVCTALCLLLTQFEGEDSIADDAENCWNNKKYLLRNIVDSVFLWILMATFKNI